VAFLEYLSCFRAESEVGLEIQGAFQAETLFLIQAETLFLIGALLTGNGAIGFEKERNAHTCLKATHALSV
jgi:hypothetical protein